jgi:hypothetical protein
MKRYNYSIDPKLVEAITKPLREQNAELLAACKAALLRLNDHDSQSVPEALQLREAIAKAEGRE